MCAISFTECVLLFKDLVSAMHIKIKYKSFLTIVICVFEVNGKLAAPLQQKSAKTHLKTYNRLTVLKWLHLAVSTVFSSEVFFFYVPKQCNNLHDKVK